MDEGESKTGGNIQTVTVEVADFIADKKLENSKENSSWGGARDGAGRKEGSENVETKVKRVAKKELVNRIIKSKDNLLNAQMNLAQGVQMLYRIEKDEDGKQKKPELVIDQLEIEGYLAGEYEGQGDYYFITTERPDNRALDSLLDRAFDKSKQPLVGGDEDDNPISIMSYERAKSIIKGGKGSDKSDSSK